MTNKNITDECCPKFDPTKWDGKKIVWKHKRFIKEKVLTVLYMPLNYGSVMTKANESIEKSEGKLVEAMVLSEHLSMWKMNTYLAVDKRISNSKNLTMSGELLAKVYEGSFSDTGKWMVDYEKFTKSKNIKTEKTYIWYTTCPKCAKKYGKNYVVILGKIK